MIAVPPGTGAEPVEEEVTRGPVLPEGEAVTRGDVARGAALAALSRLGAVIEVVSQPAFTWLFGLPTYGVYVVLWAIVNIAENLIDLSMIARNYGGGPVGVETIAAGLSEPRDAIEDIIEPYLIQQGFIQRTPRGRVLTANAWRHLGLEAPKEFVQQQISLFQEE